MTFSLKVNVKSYLHDTSKTKSNIKKQAQMKKIYLSLTFLSFVMIGFSQETTKTVMKAARDYDGFSYSKAIKKYTEAQDGSLESQRNLANSYSRIGDSENAELLYSTIVAQDRKTPADVYAYATILQQNKKYEAADLWMNKFNSLSPNDSRGIAYTDNMGSYKKLASDKGQFKVKNLEINSEQEDFAPVYYKDKVLFASSREGVKSVRREWNWNELPFLDIYQADKGEANELNMAVPFKRQLNKKFHEGPVCFSPDETKMVFTRNNYEGKSKDGLVKLQLFTSELVEGEWQKPVSFTHNSPEYSVGHASFSADEKWLYFASDMPGGIGGVDIYKVEITPDGYGSPMNLGNKINTEGNEMFPSIHESGMLFFASNGLIGLGGLDLFVAELKDGSKIGKVMNLGAPMNTNKDDFALTLDKTSKNGYFSSNREGGKGDDDIYYFDLLKPITFGKLIKGIAKDKKGDVLAGTVVDLLSPAGDKLDSVTTNDKGEFEFSVEAEQHFELKGNKEKYFEGKNTADTHTEEDVIMTDVTLEKDPGLSLYALITDKASNEPIEGTKITITDNMSGVSEEIITPASGDYRRPLMDKKLNDRGSYNLTLEKEGYLSKTLTYNTEFDKEGQYNIHEGMDLSLDKIELGGDLSKIIDINPIYFDLGKSKIRPDAATELDKIVKVMNENPNMVIELGSHTDSRGSDASNRSLSDRRAKASAAYVAERISKPERIYGKGYGESTPNTVDASTDGGEATQVLTESFINAFKSKNKNIFDKYHQYNRRTEFLIIKM